MYIPHNRTHMTHNRTHMVCVAAADADETKRKDNPDFGSTDDGSKTEEVWYGQPIAVYLC